MRRPSVLVALTAALGLAAAGVARAQDAAPAPAPAPRARVALVADVAAVAAGKPFTVALRFDMDPKWHVYWKDPGDSGMPPSVKWTLPDGYTAGDVQFPVPEKLTTPAGTNYVYHKQAAFLVTITPPADAGAKDVELKAAVRWLVCDADVCLPERQSVALTLPVAAEAKPANAEQFERWRAAIPPSDAEARARARPSTAE